MKRMLDYAFLLALAAAALAGLSTTFTGSAFFVVGLAGVVAGVMVAHVTGVLRWPAVSAVVIGLAVFVLLGGPLCLREIPSPDTISTLADQVVLGWKELLTTLPPVDGDGPLLVLPWALGLATGLLGGLTSRIAWGPALLRAALPLLAPTLLLAAVILVGVQRPQSLWVQGVAFAVLAIGWLTVRAQRASAPVQGGAGRFRLLVAGAVMVAVAGALALPVATWATGDDNRVVLRTYVEPPFDIGQYPSPLASFRRYVRLPKSEPATRSTSSTGRSPAWRARRPGRDCGSPPSTTTTAPSGEPPTTRSRAAPPTLSSGSRPRSTTPWTGIASTSR